MGRELMRKEPVFREVMEACEAAMRPYASFSLLEELARDEADSKLQQTEIAQPAIFAMQVALVALWKSLGVEPTAVAGHSVGEVAAACVAGILTLEEAARVIVLRARFMHECARGEGTMLAVSLSEEEAEAVIARHDKAVSIAAFNGPRSLTLAGAKDSLEAIRAELEPQNVFARFRAGGPPVSPRDDATGGGSPEQGAFRHRTAAGDPAVFQHRHRRTLFRHRLRRRSLGPRHSPAGPVRQGRQLDCGLRRRCLAGNQLAPGAFHVHHGMPHRPRPQGPGDRFHPPRSRTRILPRSRARPPSRRRGHSISKASPLPANCFPCRPSLGPCPLVA